MHIHSSKITDSGWITFSADKFYYRKVNGIVTILFYGYTISPPSQSSPRMPSGYQPEYMVMNTISTQPYGNKNSGDLYTVTILPPSNSIPGMIIGYGAQPTKVYGSITYPV